ncbi:MAG: flagellar biosynthetic protein FliO [Candidatus Riflebacteria bacterium]|nr:flagellar biosynthetic protein FliO [Candidatus Riflebacteria bacterium]
MKHKLFRALLFTLAISFCSASAEPVASDGNGFSPIASIASATNQPDKTIIPATDSDATASAAKSPLPFYMEGPVASAPFMPTSDPLSSTLRIISSLFAVIILAFGLSWLIQKKGGFGGNVFGKVLGILPLDNRRMIYLVDVMGRVLILGVTDSNISMLCEITDKDTLDSLRLQYEKPLPGMERLFSFLRPSTGQQETGSTKIDEEPPQTQGELQNQRNQDRLRKLNDLLVKRPPTSKD